MPTRAFSVEDGNIATKPIITSQTRTYNDLDLSFKKKTNGDIFKKNDAEAVKQSIKNILLTNRTEKPFDPNFGGDLEILLHQTKVSSKYVEKNLNEQIATYIPELTGIPYTLGVTFEPNPNNHSDIMFIDFQLREVEVNAYFA